MPRALEPESSCSARRPLRKYRGKRSGMVYRRHVRIRVFPSGVSHLRNLPCRVLTGHVGAKLFSDRMMQVLTPRWAMLVGGAGALFTIPFPWLLKRCVVALTSAT